MNQFLNIIKVVDSKASIAKMENDLHTVSDTSMKIIHGGGVEVIKDLRNSMSGIINYWNNNYTEQNIDNIDQAKKEFQQSSSSSIAILKEAVNSIEKILKTGETHEIVSVYYEELLPAVDNIIKNINVLNLNIFISPLIFISLCL